MQVAIDAQISPDVAGGTETALLTLLAALGATQGPDRFTVLAMKQFAEKLKLYMGPNQELMLWPTTYRWFHRELDNKKEMTARWRRLRTLAGPLGRAVDRAYRTYGAADTVIGPRGRRFIARWRLPMPIGARAYRMYKGWRIYRAEQESRRSHDELLRARAVEAVHFPYPLHFNTALPFLYEPWGLPHRHFPELYPHGEAEWMDEVFGGGCERAALVVTATRWVKEDIVANYGIPRHKIAVIPRRPQFAVASASDSFARDGAPRERFALFPAMTLPTKNHIGLIRALGALRDRHGVRLNVVCTGRHQTPEWPAIQAEIARFALEDQVTFLGPVPMSELHSLFRRARFLVFPSLFEGLGLPLLEAFGFGLPIVASDAACIPEVVGDAAIVFNAKDPEALVAALYRAATDDSFLRSLAERGRQRLIERFPTGERLARMFSICYRNAASRKLTPAERLQFDEMTA